MEAHEAVGRFERVAEGHDLSHGPMGRLARDAAFLVALLAGFLAIATFLANEAIKEVIQGETRASDTDARLEANDVKTTIAGSNSVLLRVVGEGSPKQAVAAAKATELENRIESEFVPLDRKLTAAVAADQRERDHADTQHLIYELAEVGFQIGIVLAGVSILTRRRWLLAGGGLLGVAGLVFLITGLAY
jgi:Domain of unknown function (DUF4337)